MNNRIAKKILTQVSSLHLNEKSVIKARKQAAKNRGYFKGKAIYLWPPLISPKAHNSDDT